MRKRNWKLANSCWTPTHYAGCFCLWLRNVQSTSRSLMCEKRQKSRKFYMLLLSSNRGWTVAYYAGCFYRHISDITHHIVQFNSGSYTCKRPGTRKFFCQTPANCAGCCLRSRIVQINSRSLMCESNRQLTNFIHQTPANDHAGCFCSWRQIQVVLINSGLWRVKRDREIANPSDFCRLCGLFLFISLNCSIQI